MNTRRYERGSVLLIAVIVVIVVTVLSVGAIRYASREVAGSQAVRKQAAVASCAEAARAMLMSQWKLLGETGWRDIAPLNVQLEPTSPTILRGGHYGDVNVTNMQIIRMSDLTTGPKYTADDLTNRIGDTVGNYRVVVHCTQGDSPNDRELEVEFGVNYGL